VTKINSLVTHLALPIACFFKANSKIIRRREVRALEKDRCTMERDRNDLRGLLIQLVEGIDGKLGHEFCSYP
jgi:hypothetical protein